MTLSFGKHGLELRLWYIPRYYGKRYLRFSSCKPHTWEGKFDNEDAFFTTRTHWFGLNLWFWMLSLEHWSRVPSRHCGVPQ